MVTVFRHHLPLASVAQFVLEGALLFGAVLLAALAYPSVGLVAASPVFEIAAVFATVMLTMNVAIGSYRRDLPAPFAAIVGRALATLVAGVPVVHLLLAQIPHGELSQGAMGYTVLLAFAGLVAVQPALQLARRAGVGQRRVLVVGAGEDAREVESSLAALRYLRLDVVGFYPAGRDEPVAIDRARLIPSGQSLNEVVARLRVQEVIVTARERRGGALPLADLLDCRLRGIVVTDFATFLERVRGQVPLAALKASWLIYSDGFAQGFARRSIKRAFDVLCAAALLVVAAPLVLAAAVAIRLESPGPILYRQRRVGRAGRTFEILKLRSMRQDAEHDGVARWASAADPRITRVGRFIRKTRIDELPQLLNILRGEMSLVGPRPERPEFADELRRQLAFYELRHSVKPGLSGWAQIRCGYAASVADARHKLEFDLYYVKNHSLFLDTLVLLETLRVVVFREGAR